jgi:hypothetical protein
MPHPHSQLSERDIERLLEGNVPPGRGDLADLARLFARVRAGAAGETAPPMSPRLLAELDAAELSGRESAELVRMLERRRVQRARRRWRVVAAAAVVAVLGGVAFASMRGPLGDDLRTRPGDDPVSVAEPEDSPSSTAPTADDGSSGGIETAGPDETSPPDFSDAEDPPGDLGKGSGSSATVTSTEVGPDEPQVTSDADWSQVAAECRDDYECWIDAAEHQCDQTGVECWGAAAQACDADDSGCRYMIVNLCGGTDECWAAVMDGEPRRHHP